jgi:glycerol-3-phosphate acyltransferase PlsY
MHWASAIGLLLLCYIIGSIPFGLIFVKLFTGKDIRHIESGRTGGTNAMRAAGPWVGLLTAFMDFIKAVVSVWLARVMPATNHWLEILAPLFIILGHNYSIFLPERKANGKLHLRGGAGGASCVGGSVGLWHPSALIILPIGALVYYFIGYASLATLSVAIVSTIVFIITWLLEITPWQYILYGILSSILLALSLRPNIQRLIQGNERIHGFRARKKEKDHSSSSSNSSSSSS